MKLLVIETGNTMATMCFDLLNVATLLDYAHTMADEEELRDYLHSIIGNKSHADSFCRNYLRRRGPRPSLKSSNTAASTAAAAATQSKSSPAQTANNTAASANAAAKATDQQSKKAKTNSKPEQRDVDEQAETAKAAESQSKAQQQQQQQKSQSKGGKKGQVVDATTIIGFRVANSSGRFNVGDIDRPS